MCPLKFIHGFFNPGAAVLKPLSFYSGILNDVSCEAKTGSQGNQHHLVKAQNKHAVPSWWYTLQIKIKILLISCDGKLISMQHDIISNKMVA